MEIKKSADKNKGMFYIEDQGKRLGYMTFTNMGDDKFSIDHTVVEPGNEGKGLGKKLVAAGVEFARDNNYKIQPLCSYAKAVMEKTPDYADVLFGANVSVESFNTVSEAINGLKAEGYTEDFNLLENTIECGGKPHKMKHDDFNIDKFFRFEGASDPADEAIVYAISSEKYNMKGVLVNGFGPSSDPLADELIQKLTVR